MSTPTTRGARRWPNGSATNWPSTRACAGSCTFWLTTHVLAVWAVAAAPPAFAATMAAALNWTGITDSYGVPVGRLLPVGRRHPRSHHRSGPRHQPQPQLVGPLGRHTRSPAASTHDTIATWLQAQASVYIVMITLALWLLRFAMSSTWLYWLATWFRPLFEVLRHLLVELYVFPICLVLGIAVGAYHLSCTAAAAAAGESC